MPSFQIEKSILNQVGTTNNELNANLSFLILVLISILIFGIVGNVISIFIFGKKKMRASPTLRFLLYLSVVDLFVLMMGISEILLKSGFSFGLRDSSLFVCNIQKFIGYSSTYISSLLSVAVNIYRAKKVSYLFHLNTEINKTKRVRFKKTIDQTNSLVDSITKFVIIFVFLLNSHFIFLLKSSHVVYFEDDLKLLKLNETQINSYDVFSCVPFQNSFYEKFLVHAWFWIDLLLYSLIPLISMTICSIIIIVNLMKLNRGYSTRLDLNSSSFTKRIYSRKLRKNIQISLILICSNGYFFITTVIFWTWFSIVDKEFLDENFGTYFKRSLVYTLLYSNNAFGILFYGLFSTQYRRHLIGLPGCNFFCREFMLSSSVQVQLKENTSLKGAIDPTIT